jgi:hypothetical protein
MGKKSTENPAEKNAVLKCNFPPCAYSGNQQALYVHHSQFHHPVAEIISESWVCHAKPIWDKSMTPVLQCQSCDKIFPNRRLFLKNHVFAMRCEQCKFLMYFFANKSLSISYSNDILFSCLSKTSLYRRGLDLGCLPCP